MTYDACLLMTHLFKLVFVDVFHTIISDPSGPRNPGSGKGNNLSHNEGVPSHIHRMAILTHIPRPSAIVKSWDTPFIGGGALRALEKHVSDVNLEDDAYAQYCSIVQLSGMGKSRLIHEFSRKHFLIPINLRRRGTGGTYNLPFCPYHP